MLLHSRFLCRNVNCSQTFLFGCSTDGKHYRKFCDATILLILNSEKNRFHFLQFSNLHPLIFPKRGSANAIPKWEQKLRNRRYYHQRLSICQTLEITAEVGHTKRAHNYVETTWSFTVLSLDKDINHKKQWIRRSFNTLYSPAPADDTIITMLSL